MACRALHDTAMASWFCSRKAGKSQVVRLVFPGGHVELLDRPVLAAEVMMQHPKFCVGRPDVFREPAGAVAAPDAVLALGHKYYVVPTSTIRRLLKYSRSPGARGASPSLMPWRHDDPGRDTARKADKKWFRFPASAGSETQRPRGECDGGIGEMGRDVDVEGGKEKGTSCTGGLPGGRQRRVVSPGATSSYSWQPSLQSITEE